MTSEERIEILLHNNKVLMREIDMLKTAYYGVYNRNTLIQLLDLYKEKLRKLLQGDLEQMLEGYSEDYLKGVTNTLKTIISKKEKRAEEFTRRS